MDVGRYAVGRTLSEEELAHTFIAIEAEKRFPRAGDAVIYYKPGSVNGKGHNKPDFGAWVERVYDTRSHGIRPFAICSTSHGDSILADMWTLRPRFEQYIAVRWIQAGDQRLFKVLTDEKSELLRKKRSQERMGSEEFAEEFYVLAEIEPPTETRAQARYVVSHMELYLLPETYRITEERASRFGRVFK